MKKILRSALLLIILSATLFGIYAFCFICNTYEPEKTRYTAVYMLRDSLERSIKYTAARDMKKTGKIYLKGTLIFINEKYEGIHVVDNHDPSNPQKIGFISIPGCIDIAAKDNILYADNAVDLVAIDLANIPQISVTKRIPYVFPNLVPPDGLYHQSEPGKGIIVGWK